MTVTLGVDPGLTGAIALLGPTGDLELLADLPVIAERSLKWIDADALRSTLMEALRGRQARAFVERSQPMPRQGVTSTFTTGAVLGSILATLQGMHVAIELVPAATWKRALGLSQDKRASLDKARLRFPTAELDRVKDHNRAESLLLAQFGRSRLRQEAA